MENTVFEWFLCGLCVGISLPVLALALHTVIKGFMEINQSKKNRENKQ